MAKRKSRYISGRIGDIKADAMTAIYGYMKHNGVSSGTADSVPFELRMAVTSASERTIEVGVPGTNNWKDIMTLSVEAIEGILIAIEDSLGIDDE